MNRNRERIYLTLDRRTLEVLAVLAAGLGCSRSEVVDRLALFRVDPAWAAPIIAEAADRAALQDIGFEED